jgi:hypothetical protein
LLSPVSDFEHFFLCGQKLLQGTKWTSITAESSSENKGHDYGNGKEYERQWPISVIEEMGKYIGGSSNAIWTSPLIKTQNSK